MSTDHYQNFRLRGIPPQYRSKADVRELVKKVFSIAPGASVPIHSLAVNPVDHDSQVATLSFHTLPDQLRDGSKNQWVFDAPVDEVLDDDDANHNRSLVFDTHFSGFTPLQHAKNDCTTE